MAGRPHPVSLRDILFPIDSRQFRGKRGVSIGLRSLHLVGTAGVGAGVLFQVPEALWHPYLVLSLASGCGMLALDTWSSAIHLIQVRGLAVLAKILMLSCLHLTVEYQKHVLFAVIILSGVVSHASARIRYHSILHGRQINTL